VGTPASQALEVRQLECIDGVRAQTIEHEHDRSSDRGRGAHRFSGGIGTLNDCADESLTGQDLVAVA